MKEFAKELAPQSPAALKWTGGAKNSQATDSKLCVDTKEGIVEPGEEISLFDQINFVKSF